MKNISAEVSIFCLWTNWIHLVTCSNIEFRELHCCSRCALDKTFEIYTFDRCSQGWSRQKSFLTCGESKKENYYLFFTCDLCDSDHVGFTARHLHQRTVEHKNFAIGKPLTFRQPVGNKPPQRKPIPHSKKVPRKIWLSYLWDAFHQAVQS